jgi:hypothetical protein
LDWIAKCILEARTAALVSEAVASCLEKELAGTLQERSLRSGELDELAKTLIAATNSPDTETPP